MLPTEDAEQTAFVHWLEIEQLRFTAIPNGTYTKSWSQKAKNHRTGLRAGFPDLVVLIPPHRSIDGQGRFLCIEMKRRTGGKVSPEQRAWIEAINALDTSRVAAYVAKGAAEAIAIVSKYLSAKRQVTIF